MKEKDRYLFFEGEKLVKDILQKGCEIFLLIVEETKETGFDIPAGAVVKDTWAVSAGVMQKISSLKEEPGFIAVLEPRETPVDFRHSRVIIGLDNIRDPGNAGTIFRCAAAFGIQAIALTGDCVNLTNTKFLRAAQDAFFDLNCQRFPGAEALIGTAKRANPALNVYLTSSRSPGKTLAPNRIEFPCLILLGSEGKGLPENLFKQYPTVTIPQTGKVESLNVGVSACIIMYELMKKNR